MKILAAFSLLLFPSFLWAIEGGTVGNGADPCPGPRFSFSCKITTDEMNSSSSKVTAVFDTERYRSIFGENGRYEIFFCPNKSDAGKWLIDVSVHNLLSPGLGINLVEGSISVPLKQSYFVLKSSAQSGDGSYKNESLMIVCTKTISKK